MKKIMAWYVGLFAALTFSVNTHGALEVRDFMTPGDGLITYDTATGLEWLDVSATKGLSYNQADASDFVVTHCFRHALYGEVRDLFEGLGLILDSRYHSHPNARYIANLMGGYTRPSANEFVGWVSYGHPTHALPHKLTYFTYGTSYKWDGYGATSKDYAHAGIGNFLVRTKDTEAPVIAPVAQDANLHLWTEESLGNANWTVQGSGNTVYQSVNGDPTFYYSDFQALSGVELSGTIKVGYDGDDDFIGIALGFEPGDLRSAEADYLLIDWKRGTQYYAGGYARRGLAVSRVTGAGSLAEFWRHIGDVQELARGAYRGHTGWSYNTEYTFTFDYTADNLKVYINGQLEFDLDAPAGNPFTNGRFAFYNFSQSRVSYKGVTVTPTLSDITVECDGAGASGVDLGTAIAVDNCDPNPVLSNDAPAVFPMGETIVTWTATDAVGNFSTHQQRVNVVDTVPPVAVARDITVALDVSGNVAITGEDIDNGSNDTCGIVSLSVTPSTFTCADVGENSVILTVTDYGGNTSIATAIVTVVDTIAPVIDCPGDLVVECDGAGNVVDSEAWLSLATATDACGMVSVSNDFVLIEACGRTGTAMVTFTAIDSSGNVATCQATFTIVDTSPPTITSDVRDFYPNETPLTFTVSAADACGEVDVQITKVTRTRITGSGKVIDLDAPKSGSKSDSASDSQPQIPPFVIDGDKVTLNDNGGVGAIITIYAAATDDCGNTADGVFVGNVLKPKSNSKSGSGSASVSGAGSDSEASGSGSTSQSSSKKKSKKKGK